MEVDGSTAAAGTAAGTAPPAPAAAAGNAVPSLEETLASFAAVSPVEGRMLTDKIAAIKANEEKSVKAMKDLEKKLEEARRRSVDNEVLRQQLLQFQNAMGSGVMQRYGMDNLEQVMGELTSRNGDVVGNTASRLIAACNARFMSIQPASAPAAAAAAAAGGAAAKRKRVAFAEPAPVASMATADVATSDLLRRALAATY